MDALETLVVKAQACDADILQRHEAFGELVKRFQNLAYGCAYAMLGDAHLAQDISQEAFITAYHNLGQLRDPRAFPGWLRRIILTHCHRLMRDKRSHTTSIEATAVLPMTSADPVAIAESHELQATILRVIQSLPEHERMVTLLFYIGGYAQSDIAAFLELPLTTVKKRLQYARERLKDRMLNMVRDNLEAQRPSNDDRFVQNVQLALLFDAGAMEGQLAMVELLLLDGMDVNARDAEGQTLLSWAAQRGHFDAVEFLLQHGADISLQDKEGRTPLERASEQGNWQIVELLRQHGARA